MKKNAPAVLAAFSIAGVLLAPCPASAQSYPGLMSPQQGYHAPPPPAASPADTADAAAESQANAVQIDASPYSGTGADTHTGHVTVSGPGAEALGDTAGEAGGETAEAAPESEDTDTDHGSGPAQQASFAGSFAPKEKAWVDPNQSKNLYDFVQASAPGNRMDAPGRRLQAQADAALQAQRDETDRANAERTEQQNEAIRASADQIQDNLRKKQEDAQDGIDSSQDQAP